VKPSIASATAVLLLCTKTVPALILLRLPVI
jgi:hypothetical protein